MKRIYQYLSFLLAAVLLLHSSSLQAQQYGNEWINYNNTYYKFKVGQSGIYRIPKTVLDAAGIPSGTTGSQFAVFRDGQEIPVYVSTSSAFGSSDYIEFYATKADGKLDLELYGNARIQGDNRISLFTDTAAYFLTYDNQSHVRYTQSANSIPGSPTPLASCTAISGQYYKNTFALGEYCAPKSQFTSSQFTRGEGWINGYFAVGSALTAYLPAPGITTGFVTLNASLMGFSYDSAHKVRVYVNNQQVTSVDSTFRPVDTKLFNLSVPASMFTSSNNEIKFVAQNVGFPIYDYWGISFAELQYPRNFDAGNTSYFEFGLPYSSVSQYIEVTNFNHGGTAPRLYDVTNKQWYAGDISVSGKTRFYLDPSNTLGDRQLILYSVNNTLPNLSNPKTIHFTDYSNTANQGTYLIITHTDLMQTVNGHNYIQEYKDYRSSTTGGSYTVRVADVTELYDQFAYGTDIHPLSIKHFLKYAYDHWNVKPQYAYLIGRGMLYYKYRNYQSTPSAYPYPIVPTYGDPGADIDFVNFGTDMKAALNIGRLAAWNMQEIGNYLEKVKAYEAGQKAAAFPTAATELWKKKVLHIAGSADVVLQNDWLLPTLQLGADIVKDTSMGAVITTIAKNTTSTIDQINSAAIDSMLNNGLSIITFHGHASSGGFDFNLNAPEQYHSAPRQPLFLALGCDVAQMFDLIAQKTISEKYIAAQNGGSIAMIAADNSNYVDFLQYYMQYIYSAISKTHYGATLGEQYRYTYDALIGLNDTSTNYFLAHLESLLFQGDPGLKLYSAAKPDYHVSNNAMSSIPTNVTTTTDSFKLKIVAYNLGRAIYDTVTLRIEHTDPSGTKKLIGNYTITKLFSSDTLSLSIPVNKLSDLGLNKYTATIDPENKYDELSEINNGATFDLFIYSDNLIPVYPYEFAIVNQQNLTLKASTLNPFRPVGRYRMEIDTTEQFNSPFKQQTTITSASGVVKWTPTITMHDSTVYYWRTAYDSTVNGNYQWSNSSFIYLAQGSPGWNQSHYYQYQKDNFDALSLDNDRKFRFTSVNTVVTVYNTIMYSSVDVNNSKVQWNYVDKQRSGCSQNNSIQIMMFDSATGTMWPNTYVPNQYLNYASGCNPPCLFNTRNTLCSEFALTTPASRELARKLLDTIPDGTYILIKNLVYIPAGYIPAPASDWLMDSVTNGNGKSLYRTLKNQGFSQIDSVGATPKAFYFMYQKNRNGFATHQDVSDSATQVLHEDFNLPVFGYKGSLISKVVGPAKSWQSLKWRTSNTLDTATHNDSAYVRIYGIDANSNETQVYAGVSRDTSLSFIDSNLYHSIRLEWMSRDSFTRTSPQLDYWRVLYAPVPEAALNPGIHFAWQDSLQAGQLASLSLAIENLTPTGMDSMLVKYRLIDANNTTHVLGTQRYRKLPGNDTMHAVFSFDPKAYPGLNQFFIEANPDNDQPEQYHPNNLGYLPLKVISDKYNPLLDVTFDGVHILDRDIVSSKPYIKILLKDENKYSALDDTSLVSVYIHYPHDGPSVRRRVPFDGSTCKFIPATISSSGKNEAAIEYRPLLTEDSTYELYVSAHDKAGNDAGGAAKTDYQISFTIFNKPGITNVLNYPNPFSTSTAFVFTLTGYEIPSQFKIQIMTVTGKVVREITKAELGPLHVGRNITEYKWDGRDQYGQLLGNGVYLYRVVTMLDGNNLEHRANMDGKGGTSMVDKYFKNGYGKMYIMR